MVVAILNPNQIWRSPIDSQPVIHMWGEGIGSLCGVRGRDGKAQHEAILVTCKLCLRIMKKQSMHSEDTTNSA
jgi:hypothetical protein